MSGSILRARQVKAFRLTNLELLEKLNFCHSEQDEVYSGIIWSSQGYWVLSHKDKVTICCNMNDNLRVWTVDETTLLAHAHLTNGFDLDAIPCDFEGNMARMDLINRFI